MTYEVGAPFQVHSETSREAAELIVPNVLSLREQVFRFVRDMGEQGATDEEIQMALDMNPSTQRPRRIELQKAGRVIAAPDLRRRTMSGRWATIWKAVSR